LACNKYNTLYPEREQDDFTYNLLVQTKILSLLDTHEQWVIP